MTDNFKMGVLGDTGVKTAVKNLQKHMPRGEAALTAVDCYRFVLSNPHVDVCLCGQKLFCLRIQNASH